MAEEWETGYLQMLEEELKNNSVKAFIEEIDGTPALFIQTSPADSKIGESYAQISIEHAGGNCSQLLLMVKMYGNIEESIFANIEKVTARINEVLTVGNVFVSYEERALFYNYALIFTEDMPEGTITRQLGLAITLAGKIIDAITNMLDPLIEGKISADELISRGIGRIR